MMSVIPDMTRRLRLSGQDFNLCSCEAVKNALSNEKGNKSSKREKMKQRGGRFYCPLHLNSSDVGEEEAPSVHERYSHYLRA
jgi:hypothetical protein